MTELPVWDLLLRGAVGGMLSFHALHLLLPGPRAAARVALGMFTLSLIAYLFCQQAWLLAQVARPVVWGVLALCTSATAWLWLAARALFDDRFGWSRACLAAAGGMIALGLAAHAPRLEQVLASGMDPGPGVLATVHAAAMVAFTAAAVWEVLRGWRVDLVEPRRVARRWVALGIGVYAAVALAVELAVRDRPVGPLLPALHVLGIGIVATALPRAWRPPHEGGTAGGPVGAGAVARRRRRRTAGARRAGRVVDARLQRPRAHRSLRRRCAVRPHRLALGRPAPRASRTSRRWSASRSSSR